MKNNNNIKYMRNNTMNRTHKSVQNTNKAATLLKRILTTKLKTQKSSINFINSYLSPSPKPKSIPSIFIDEIKKDPSARNLDVSIPI